jgi:CRP-like cAMP-binding protein
MKNFVTEHFWCIKQINIFRDLSEADAHALAQITKFRTLKHEEQICEEGVYLIKEGRVKISSKLPNANSQDVENRSEKADSSEKQDSETKDVLEQGEILGVISEDLGILNENITIAETLTEVNIGIVTIRNFSFFLKRKPHLALPLPRRRQVGFSNVFGITTNPFLGSRNKKKQVGQLNLHNILKTSAVPDCKRANPFGNIMFRCASSRFALLLQNLALSPDKNGVVCVPRLSTKRMSKLIGSSSETIETLLKTFKQYHIIDKRRGQIQILNPWQLKKIADARMKTLFLPQMPVPTSDDDIDLAMLISPRDENNSQNSSTTSSA